MRELPGRRTPARLPGAFCLGLALLAGAACGGESSAGAGSRLDRAADDAWSGPRLHAFRFQEASGREVALADLEGEPFVLDFVFTACAGPCPLMSASMRELQRELGESSVRLVSVTVDPRTDTLEVLREYARRYDADGERWLFLRGDEQATAELARSIALPAVRDDSADPGFRVAHSTRLVVVDGEGRVRGYYDGTTPEGRAQAAARARWLERR